MNDPVVIQAAVTGPLAGADASPYLPLTHDQIANEAVAAWRAGATIIHIHARNHDGTPTQSRDRYAEIAEAVRATDCDAILNRRVRRSPPGPAGGQVHGGTPCGAGDPSAQTS